MRTWITGRHLQLYTLNSSLGKVEMEPPPTGDVHHLHELMNRKMKVVEMLELLLLARMAVSWTSTSKSIVVAREGVEEVDRDIPWWWGGGGRWELQLSTQFECFRWRCIRLLSHCRHSPTYINAIYPTGPTHLRRKSLRSHWSQTRQFRQFVSKRLEQFMMIWMEQDWTAPAFRLATLRQCLGCLEGHLVNAGILCEEANSVDAT